MNHPKKDGGAQAQDEASRQPADASEAPAQADTQPAPSGPPGASANRGSPAAPVMKQFAKTKAESTGRP